MKATLILENWESFEWISFWYEANITGEIVFNTGMVWYSETLTDPSYKEQILTFTFPLIWNYGIPDFNLVDFFWLKKYFESDNIHLNAIIVSEYSETFNHQEAKKSLWEFLKENKKIWITWIDTRKLTKIIRKEGTMVGKIIIWEENIGNENFHSLQEIEEKQKYIEKTNFSKKVSFKEIIKYWKWKKKICLVDMWVKNNIIRNLLEFDTEIIRVPYNYPFMDWSIEFDGIFISNWPWNPENCTETINELKKAIKSDKNIFWICLWNQLIALASWAKTYKLKYWHRWQNQPCRDLKTKKCIITSQNHSYAIDNESLWEEIETWFENINDKTNEWIKFKNKNISSVQFHPESCPWPSDSKYLFKDFVESL